MVPGNFSLLLDVKQVSDKIQANLLDKHHDYIILRHKNYCKCQSFQIYSLKVLMISDFMDLSD